MPSQREEIVMSSDSTDAKRVGKDCCEANFDVVARRDEMRVDGEAPLVGLRQPHAVYLAVRRERHSRQLYKRCRDRMLRQGRLQEFAQRVRRGRRIAAGDEIGDEPPISQVVVADDDRGVRNIRMFHQCGFDLAQLDADAAKLDLTIAAAVELECAIGAAKREVARPVHPRPRLGAVGIGNESARGELGALPVTAADADAADAQLPYDADRHRLVMAIDDVDPRVVDRSADRNESTIAVTAARKQCRDERRFGGSVCIDDRGVAPRGKLGGNARLEHLAR